MEQRESEFLHSSHNVSNLVYHIVCPAKYRKEVFSDNVEEHLRSICLEIEKRFEWIRFLEIGSDKNHVHFLIQSTPDHSVSDIVKVIKSITARQILQECPEVKRWLWGGKFWTEGYFASTVGKFTNENVIRNYVKTQGEDCAGYKQLMLNI